VKTTKKQLKLSIRSLFGYFLCFFPLFRLKYIYTTALITKKIPRKYLENTCVNFVNTPSNKSCLHFIPLF